MNPFLTDMLRGNSTFHGHSSFWCQGAIRSLQKNHLNDSVVNYWPTYLPLVLRPDYSGRTKSIPWILMSWLLLWQSHQQTYNNRVRWASLSTTKNMFPDKKQRAGGCKWFIYPYSSGLFHWQPYDRLSSKYLTLKDTGIYQNESTANLNKLCTIIRDVI